MSHYTTVLNEMLNLLPRHQFETLVRKHDSDRYVKRFNSWHQLVTMLYAQASGKQSLRDIQRGLEVHSTHLYHLGLPNIKRSTLSDANSNRSCKVFEGLFYRLLSRCQEVAPNIALDSKTLYTAWMQPLSTYAYLSSLGLASGAPKEVSNCTMISIIQA